MKTTPKLNIRAATLVAALALTATAAHATDNKVETRLGSLAFDHALPTPETRQKLYDEMDYQRRGASGDLGRTGDQQRPLSSVHGRCWDD
jgi:hypothetical protein